MAGQDARVCVVGDTPRDIEAARANSLPVIAVATGRYSFDELLELHPEVCATSLADLLSHTGPRHEHEDFWRSAGDGCLRTGDKPAICNAQEIGPHNPPAAGQPAAQPSRDTKPAGNETPESAQRG